MAELAPHAPHKLLIRAPDIQIWQHPTAECCLVSLAGLAGDNDKVRFEFIATAARTNAHVVLLKDERSAWYRHGTPTLGTSLDQMAVGLRSHLRALRIRRLVFAGASAGGYAAIHLGLRLRADQVLAFGPQVFVSADTRALFADTRWQADLDAAGLTYNFEESIRPNGETRITLFAGQDEIRDLVHVSRLANEPSVDISITPDTDHAVGAALRAKGLLTPFINQSVHGLLPRFEPPAWLAHFVRWVGPSAPESADSELAKVVIDAMEDGGEWAGALTFVGRVLFSEGRNVEAEHYFKRALVAADPKSGASYFAQTFLVKTLARQNRLKEALPIAQAGVERSPARPGTWECLAQVLEATGDIPGALSALKEGTHAATGAHLLTRRIDQLMARYPDLRKGRPPECLSGS